MIHILSLLSAPFAPLMSEIPPIRIPGGPIVLSPTSSEMHDLETLARYEPRLSAAERLFDSASAGVRVRIHQIAEAEGRVDWVVERTHGGWQLFVVRWRSGWVYPKPFEYCACVLIDQALSAAPDMKIISRHLTRAARKIVFADTPEQAWGHYDWSAVE